MKYFLIMACVALLIAIVASEHQHEHQLKKSVGAVKHAEVDKKKHYLSKSGKKATHEHEKAQKGKSEAVIHKKEDVEKGGKKHHSVDEGKHHVAKHEEKSGGHKAQFKQGEKQKKAGFVKGYREQYHKDEHKKADSFYSNKHKSGHWLKYGSGKSKHHAVHHDKDGHGKYQAAKHSDSHEKKQKFSEHKANKKHDAHSKKYDQHKKKGH